MRKKCIVLFITFLSLVSCSDKDEQYIAVSPVKVDLTLVPYPKLSDYHFFEGEIKNLNPSLNVIPYEPASSLFSDYALKKRFVWLPQGKKATYTTADKIIELPIGAALIKSFYYTNVQPDNTTRIIETRVMIRKSNGWLFADYVWNEQQNEAYLDLNGSNQQLSWKDETNTIRSVNYRIPNKVQCNVCHKYKETINGVYFEKQEPIGIKPQNLNFNYNYGSEIKNQLAKWVEVGYLDSNFIFPTSANTIVDYNDSSKPIELRVRSYFDINCSHCHNTNGHCDYRPMEFSFNKTGLPNGVGQSNMGVCVSTQDLQEFPPALSKIITPGNTARSMLFYRLNTDNENYRMPLHGRTMIHQEGINLVEEWINSLSTCQ